MGTGAGLGWDPSIGGSYAGTRKIGVAIWSDSHPIVPTRRGSNFVFHYNSIVLPDGAVELARYPTRI